MRRLFRTNYQRSSHRHFVRAISVRCTWRIGRLTAAGTQLSSRETKTSAVGAPLSTLFDDGKKAAPHRYQVLAHRHRSGSIDRENVVNESDCRPQLEGSEDKVPVLVIGQTFVELQPMFGEESSIEQITVNRNRQFVFPVAENIEERVLLKYFNPPGSW